MAKNRNEQASRSTLDADDAARAERGVYQSGVVDKALVDRVRRISDPDPWRVGEDPPWSIVERYLTTGEYRELIEEHARTSRAFADVIEALRNDEEERDEGPSSGGCPGAALAGTGSPDAAGSPDIEAPGDGFRFGSASAGDAFRLGSASAGDAEPHDAPRSRGKRTPLRVVR